MSQVAENRRKAKSSPKSADTVQVDEKSERKVNEKGEAEAKPREVGGRKGPDPTRYGDWEKNGRCIDF